MLQYLLNATAIWLISLVLFDVFLRRESYHGYNRFYLLATFLLGIFLPLVQWEEDSRPLVQTLQQPMERVIAAKQNIVAATTPAASADWQQWVAVIYVAGILVALCLLVIEVIKLVSCYRSRKKSYDGRWPIIETGKDHAPFSFLNTLFVCSKGQYSANEWNMILVHEHRHSALLHFADLLLMQAARIIFWFHPLVYVYNKRLLLVHEFQADSVAAGQPQVYGTFLIEQAVLQAAPSVSHSFNRSPIKNRIVMLTRKSSAASRVKMLVFIPLAMVCIVCFSKNSFSQKSQKQGNILVYKGNTIEFTSAKPPTTMIDTNRATGKIDTRKVNWAIPPVKLNGDKVYAADPYRYPNLIAAKITGKDKTLAAYIFRNLKNELSNLEDGDYFITIPNVLIDKSGHVVYFENEGLFKIGGGIDAQLKSKELINKKINALMDNAPLFKSAESGGYAVPYLISNTFGYVNNNNITVKDHNAKWANVID